MSFGNSLRLLAGAALIPPGLVAFTLLLAVAYWLGAFEPLEISDEQE